MARLWGILGLSLVVFTTGCATPAVMLGPVPAPPPGMAQIVIYRRIAYYEPSDVLRVFLDHASIGFLPRGDVVYRDLPPGRYTIRFSPTRPYPHQFKTLTLASRQTVYVKLEALPHYPCLLPRQIGGCVMNGYTAVVIDPAVARREIRGLNLIRN